MNCSIIHNFKGKDLEINFKHRIHFKDMEDIILGIVEGVFAEGTYMPYRFDYYYWYLILAQYSDLNLDEFEADEFYELIEDNEFIEKINTSVSNAQIGKIIVYANKLIENKLNEHPLKTLMEDFHDTLSQAKQVIDMVHDKPELMERLGALIQNSTAITDKTN